MIGTILEDNTSLFNVDWENGETWNVLGREIELIEEQTYIENMTIEDFLKQQIEELKIELANKQARIDWLEGNLAAYKEVFEMAVKK